MRGGFSFSRNARSACEIVHGFFAGREDGELARRKTADGIVQRFWQVLGADPGGTFDVRAVERGGDLDALYGVTAELGPSKVSHNQHRAGGLLRDNLGNMLRY